MMNSKLLLRHSHYFVAADDVEGRNFAMKNRERRNKETLIRIIN